MEATCPRCSFRAPELNEQLLSSGVCPQCGSQTYFSQGEQVRPNREGCIAATFEVNSAIASPFPAVFVESKLSSAARSTPPPTPNEDRVHDEAMSDDEKPKGPDEALPGGGLGDDLFQSAELPGEQSTPGLFDSSDVAAGPPPAPEEAAHDPLSEDVDMGDFDAPGDPDDSEDVDMGEFDTPAAEDSVEVDLGDFDAPAEDDSEDVDLGDLDAPASAPVDPEPVEGADEQMPGPIAEDRPPENEPSAPVEPEPVEGADEPGAEEPAPEAPMAADGAEEPVADTESPAESPDTSSLPAHLQLPAIDFSLPTGSSDGSTATPSVSSGSSDGVELPAHLNLPSFPQFDLPPVPGEETEAERRLSDGTEVAGIEGAEGSFAEFDDTSGVGEPPAPGGDGWAVGAPAAGPPPMPPPMPSKAKAPQSPPPPSGLPSLPTLPELPKAPEPKRDPTLINRHVEPDHTGGGKGLYIAGALVAVLIAAVVGAFMYKDLLIETVADPTAGVDESTLQAQKIRIESRQLWADANDLYKKKKVDDAIAKVLESLALDPAFGKSHRLLGVLYAEQKNSDQAVRHYKRYLELEPDAPDAKDVKQIVDDYEKSKAGNGKK